MRRTILSLLLIALISAGPTTKSDEPPKAATTQDGISIYFSPNGNCTEAVVYWVGKAEKKIDIAAYSVTSASIAKSIADAHRRGVKVRVVMDKTQSAGKYSSATYLHNAGVPVTIDSKGGLMHNKYLVIDAKIVITGSFNLTKGAEEDNAENLLVIEGKDKIVQAYTDDFAKVLKASKPYEGVRP